jgi:two-component system chemotaxis response regulator CheB
LGVGPRENNARPAIDAMFRSIAACCGPRAVAAVLSGTLGDGAAGLWAIKQAGGLAVVQEPSDAAYPQMPEAALNRVQNADHVVALAGMPALLAGLVGQPACDRGPPLDGIDFEVGIALSGGSNMSEMDQLGTRSVLTCPDCHGVMWEIDEKHLMRYRCHQGHAYTEEVMRLAIDENLRRALGSSLRALEERIALANRLRDHARDRGHPHAARTWERNAAEYEKEAEIIRQSLRRLDEAAALLG